MKRQRNQSENGAKQPEPAKEVPAPSASAVTNTASEAAEGWCDLQELPTGLVRAPNMPIDMLPDQLREWVADICARMCVSVEMIAVPAVIGLATVAGRRVGLRPKEHDRWTVVPNLWGALVARPGSLKSAAMSEALRPLQRLAYEARQRYEASCKERKPQIDYVESVIEALEANLKGSLRKGEAGDDLRDKIERRQAEREALATVEKRYMTNDPRSRNWVNFCATILTGCSSSATSSSVCCVCWIPVNHPNDRAFYCECWNGDGDYDYDRISRGTIHIESACLSVLGSIQPGPLRDYVNAAIDGGRRADGLLQRLQLTVWPDDVPDWVNVDRYPDTSAQDRAFEIFTTLDGFDPRAFGAEDDDDRGIPALRFAPDAQKLFDGWRNELEERLRSEELRGCPAFAAHLAKYRSLMPSLALLFHLVDVAIDVSVDPRVSLCSTELASQWCGYLELHAAKLYGREVPVAGRGLAAHIKRGDVRDGMKLRDVYRNEWQRLGSADDVRAAVAELLPYGWARIEKRSTGGRPSEVVRLHPDLRG